MVWNNALRIITENELIEVLRMQLGIEFVDLTKVSIPTELAQALPKNIARQYNVVPVRIAKDELYLAMNDLLNFYAIEEARRAAKRKIVPLVATNAGIEHAIQILYSSEGAAKAIAEMKREAATNGDAVEAPDNSFATMQLGEDALSSAPTIRLVNSMVTKEAVGLTGSDLEKYDEMLKNRNGVILLVGPTGSGKTTTMYAMINQLNTPDVNMVTLEDLGVEMEPGLRFYRGTGCAHCYNTGYRGRTAVFEMLPITRAVRTLIYEQRGRDAIEEELKRPENGFVSLRDNALRLMREGVTTGEEVLRIVHEGD